jgi:hypothetical protein
MERAHRLTALPALAFTNHKPDRAIVVPLMTGVFLRRESPASCWRGFFCDMAVAETAPSRLMIGNSRRPRRRRDFPFACKTRGLAVSVKLAEEYRAATRSVWQLTRKFTSPEERQTLMDIAESMSV